MTASNKMAGCGSANPTENMKLIDALGPSLLKRNDHNDQLTLSFEKSVTVKRNINKLIKAEQSCGSALSLKMEERLGEYLLTVQSTAGDKAAVENYFLTAENPTEVQATKSHGESGGWFRFAKPVSGVLTLCMLCCALPYILLVTGLVGASTAAYLSSKVEIGIGMVVLVSVLFMLFRHQSRGSSKKVLHENI